MSASGQAEGRLQATWPLTLPIVNMLLRAPLNRLQGNARSATGNVLRGTRHVFAKDFSNVFLTMAAAQQGLRHDGAFIGTPDFDEAGEDRIV